MSKKQYFQQISIDDDHMEEFDRLIFDELLFYVKRIPFDHIIENNLQNNNNAVYQITEANSLNCLFTADRKLIN
jgi:hypothetical protein